MSCSSSTPACPLDQSFDTAVLADAAQEAAHTWLTKARAIACKNVPQGGANPSLAREAAMAFALGTIGQWTRRHESDMARAASKVEPRFAQLLQVALRDARRALTRTGHNMYVSRDSQGSAADPGVFLKHMLMNVASRPVSCTDSFVADSVDGEICRYIVYRRAARRALALMCYDDGSSGRPELPTSTGCGSSSLSPAPSPSLSPAPSPSSLGDRVLHSSSSAADAVSGGLHSVRLAGDASHSSHPTVSSASAVSFSDALDIDPDDSASCVAERIRASAFSRDLRHSSRPR